MMWLNYGLGIENESAIEIISCCCEPNECNCEGHESSCSTMISACFEASSAPMVLAQSERIKIIPLEQAIVEVTHRNTFGKKKKIYTVVSPNFYSHLHILSILKPPRYV